MEVRAYLENLKELHFKLLTYLDNEDDTEENYNNLLHIIKDQKIGEDRHKLETILRIILKISDNHYRSPRFFGKITKIILFFKDEIIKLYTNMEIFDFFKSNKRVLLILVEEKILTIDRTLTNLFLKRKYTTTDLLTYFSEETKPFIDDIMADDDAEETNAENLEYGSYQALLTLMKPFIKENAFKKSKKNLIPKNFETKRRLGENDNHICELIREDSITAFKEYVKKKKIELDSYVEESIYETNQFLLQEQGEMTLIEYAAFFGSFEIFKYIHLSGIDLYPSLWLFAIHGNSYEIIHYLEDNNVKIKEKLSIDEQIEVEEELEKYADSYDDENEDDTFIDRKVTYNYCLREAIKCHHNEIAQYILDTYINKKKKNIEITDDNYKENIVSYAFCYYNFSFIPENISDKYLFFYSCENDIYTIVDLLIKNQKVDVNEAMISNTYYFHEVSNEFYFEWNFNDHFKSNFKSYKCFNDIFIIYFNDIFFYFVLIYHH